MRLTLLKSNKVHRRVLTTDPSCWSAYPSLPWWWRSFFFGQNIFSDARAAPLVCYGVSLYYTFFFWIAFRQVYVYLIRKMPEDHEVRKRRNLHLAVGHTRFLYSDLVLSGFPDPHCRSPYRDKESPNFVVNSFTSLVFFTLLIMSFNKVLSGGKSGQTRPGKSRCCG